MLNITQTQAMLLFLFVATLFVVIIIALVVLWTRLPPSVVHLLLFELV